MFKNVILLLLPLCVLVTPFAATASSSPAELKPLYGKKPQASTAAGLAPVNVKGMDFHLVTTTMYDSDDDSKIEDGKLDVSCVFGTGNRVKIHGRGEPEDGDAWTEIFNYVKTGPNTAFVTYWSGLVFPDGHESGGATCEAHLTFTHEGSGSIKYVTYGHGFDTYGTATFTLKKK